MTMRPARKSKGGTSTGYTEYEDHSNTVKYDVLLQPGDVLALSKEARYDWEHGIDKRLADEVDGDIIERGTRISVTLRKLKDGEERSPLATNHRK
ncbi:hypothetical protein BDF20DRAFT_274650 [Mycotypha africana]|uniref:uncharacterized protein n=1 Tax=Mycotypha africana TaxID=64632 RepID=UPI0023005C79|nr:uncharacterized protein BDF20DRAFT_274650 [Mycotypha africana]KAI8987568.1 hypothetical protein BDF20DRAFT_274650 [Mycotypha africana]